MRYTRRDGLLFGGAILAVVLLYGGYLWLQAQPPRAPTASAPGTPEARCAGALARVQQYQPPGARGPLEAVLLDALRVREPGGYRVDGWEGPRVNVNGSRCLVWFHYSARNAQHTLTWTYTPDTGRVEADDDATRQMSGW